MASNEPNGETIEDLRDFAEAVVERIKRFGLVCRVDEPIAGKDRWTDRPDLPDLVIETCDLQSRTPPSRLPLRLGEEDFADDDQAVLAILMDLYVEARDFVDRLFDGTAKIA